jgi:hypothetical protein
MASARISLTITRPWPCVSGSNLEQPVVSGGHPEHLAAEYCPLDDQERAYPQMLPEKALLSRRRQRPKVQVHEAHLETSGVIAPVDLRRGHVQDGVPLARLGNGYPGRCACQSLAPRLPPPNGKPGEDAKGQKGLGATAPSPL